MGFGVWFAGECHDRLTVVRIDGGHSVLAADANVRHAVAAGAFIDHAPRIMLDTAWEKPPRLEQPIG